MGQKQWLLLGWIAVGGIERLDCLEFAWHGGYGVNTEPSFNIAKRELIKGPAAATARTRVQELAWPPSCTQLTHCPFFSRPHVLCCPFVPCPWLNCVFFFPVYVAKCDFSKAPIFPRLHLKY